MRCDPLRRSPSRRSRRQSLTSYTTSSTLTRHPHAPDTLLLFMLTSLLTPSLVATSSHALASPCLLQAPGPPPPRSLPSCQGRPPQHSPVQDSILMPDELFLLLRRACDHSGHDISDLECMELFRLLVSENRYRGVGAVGRGLRYQCQM